MKNFLRINRLYLGILVNQSKMFFLYRLLLIGLNSLSAVALVVFPNFFFDAITEKGNFTQAIVILLGYLFYTIVNATIVNLLNSLIGIINEDVKYKMKQCVMERVYKIPFAQFDDPECYDRIQRAADFVDSGRYQTIDIIASFLSDIISLSAVLYVLSQLNLWIILFLLLAMVAEYVVNLLRDKAVFKNKNELTRLRRQINYFFQTSIKKEKLKDLRLNNAQEFVASKYNEAYLESRKKTVRLNTNLLFLQLPTRITDAIFMGSLYGFLGKDLFLGTITMGGFTMMMSAAQNIKSLILTMQIGVSQLRQSALEAQNFYDIFDNSSMIQAATTALPKEYENKPFNIRFEHVTFTYPGQTTPAIRDLSFNIDGKQKVVLVGENGAGKSTIIKLMLGLYEPDSGKVLINEHNIQELDKESLYSHISVVFQDHSEFSFTIAENVLMNIETNEKESIVRKVLDSVGLSSHIYSRPLKEKTPLTRELSSEGIDLSGGERQKLAIARAYAKQAQLLIMDEPSSSLDAYAEKEMYNHFLKLSLLQTSVLITHRVLFLKGFDRILYVEKGKIIEDGTHQDLLKKQGAYFNMYKIQNAIHKETNLQ